MTADAYPNPASSSNPISILIIDDDQDVAELLRVHFRLLGCNVEVARDGRTGLDCLYESAPDILFLDLLLPDLDGMEILEKVRLRGIDCVVIVITGYGTIERAVQAIQQGAQDVLEKPIDPPQLTAAFYRALDRHQLRVHNKSLAEHLDRQYGGILTEDPKFLRLIADMRRAAATHATILLLGESGTGKELVARHLHKWSPRASHPFVAVNSAAIPETLLESDLFGHEKGAFTGADRQRKGHLEQAHGGTLFLDEIGSLAEATQAKLLRVIQDREFQRVGGEKLIRVDVRIIAATNGDLRKAVEQGRFRDDLYYRLNVVTFRLPPLRKRPADVPLLARHFLQKFQREVGARPMELTEETLACLQSYAWPGNVREMRNVMERLAVLVGGGPISPAALPDEILTGPSVGRSSNPWMSQTLGGDGSYHGSVRSFQRQLLEDALRKCAGNQTRAAEMLKLSRPHFCRLMRQLDVR